MKKHAYIQTGKSPRYPIFFNVSVAENFWYSFPEIAHESQCVSVFRWWPTTVIQNIEHVILWLVIVWKLIGIGIHMFCLLNFNNFLEHEQKSDLFLSMFTMVFKDNHKNACWNTILDLQTWIGVNKKYYGTYLAAQ
jgi:hypothetical protein